MSQVLQHSYQGEVKLYSEKISEHVATVTVGSLTSTAADLERRSNLIEGNVSQQSPSCVKVVNFSLFLDRSIK